ncbi:hypothetical protein [Streptomyces sp. NRRL F-2580]|uniref:hypothetical protein n=1 Tax=Streptomyces sp. NRRL F-2580 TaxID=1463841 RepID=UPI0004CB19DB|nr:hypothetical protein [Streptomyces sp. NRRL F-2580]
MPPADVQMVRDQAAAINRHRQGANLPAVAVLLPALQEDLNTTILMHVRGTAEWDEVCASWSTRPTQRPPDPQPRARTACTGC